jgi:hypothetical protein
LQKEIGFTSIVILIRKVWQQFLLIKPLIKRHVTHRFMDWKSYKGIDYDAQLYELLHCGLDRLIDLGSRLEAHGDVLATHEIDLATGERTQLPDVHPEQLLVAQLGLDGAEEEVEVTQELVKIVSRIMIIRNARNLINQPTEL